MSSSENKEAPNTQAQFHPSGKVYLWGTYVGGAVINAISAANNFPGPLRDLANNLVGPISPNTANDLLRIACGVSAIYSVSLLIGIVDPRYREEAIDQSDLLSSQK